MSPEAIAIISTFVGVLLLFLYNYIKITKRNKALRDSMEDETIIVPGIGKVNFDEISNYTRPELEYETDTKEENETEEVLAEDYPIEDLPLTEERRQWLDKAFFVIENAFGKELLTSKKMTLPTDEPFSLKIHTEADIITRAQYIAGIMDIDSINLEVNIFENGVKNIDPKTGEVTYVGQEWYAGLYLGKNEAGKNVISIANNIHDELDKLTATISHELSHVKLLGENRMTENNEDLTDMLPLFFGLGIFSANTVFKFNKLEEGGWSHSNLGYLSQMDWGYLFALYTFIREETDPEWLLFLNKSIASDYQKSTEFIKANPDLVLQHRL